ncbi:HAD family hydrolase [Reyranella sp.]|uniref:HAD family hydrolase n=1 Tax=Reyranella sp. TaxID=1929291 RepID=UPI003BAA9DF8
MVFDMGGVLLDWNPRHLYRKLIPDAGEMERFLATVTTSQWHGLQDRGGDPAEATRRLQAENPGQEALIEAFYGRFDEMLDHAFPPMAALVERLHDAGTKLYLLSNAPAFIDPWLRGPARHRHPFLGCFSDYVVSGLVGCCKPDAAIYDLVCRTGSFRPGEAVLVDDVLSNVEGARRFGMHAVQHRSPEATVDALRTLGLPA